MTSRPSATSVSSSPRACHSTPPGEDTQQASELWHAETRRRRVAARKRNETFYTPKKGGKTHLVGMQHKHNPIVISRHTHAHKHAHKHTTRHSFHGRTCPSPHCTPQAPQVHRTTTPPLPDITSSEETQRNPKQACHSTTPAPPPTAAAAAPCASVAPEWGPPH